MGVRLEKKVSLVKASADARLRSAAAVLDEKRYRMVAAASRGGVWVEERDAYFAEVFDACAALRRATPGSAGFVRLELAVRHGTRAAVKLL